jgi:hypothetical protein
MTKSISKVKVYKKYIFGEMSKNKMFGIDDLDHLVESLSASQSKLMCRYFSYLRKNSVYDFIKSGPDNWKGLTVDINNIYVEKVNNGVNALLEKNEWSLAKIVEDSEIGVHEEFKKQGEIDSRLAMFIAKKAGDKYKIVDGIHRVIRLGFDGKKEFELIYY